MKTPHQKMDEGFCLTSPPVVFDPMGGFDTFWRAYPNKVAKRAAMKAWKQVGGAAKLVQILAVLELRRSDEWFHRNKTLIPYPATFLRGEDFEDYEVEARADDPVQGTHLCRMCSEPHQWQSDDPTDFASYEMACQEFRSTLTRNKTRYDREQ